MARIQIAAEPWGVLLDRNGNGLAGLTPTILDSTGAAATVYAASTGATTATPTSDSAGRVPGYLEEGTYTYTVNGDSYTVQAVSGSLRSSLPANVRDSKYGTTDTTGATSSQTAIAAAVADAYANGRELYFPAGTYLTTASIPNFHDVQKRGPGVVKRGGFLFPITPRTATPNVAGTTNILYADPAGTTANDGLTPSQPTTLAQAFLYLTTYGPTLEGTWKVLLAAGTYTGTFTVPAGLRSRNRLVVQGPTVGHPNVPTAIIDMAGQAIGLVLGSYTYGQLRDIKVINGDVATGGDTTCSYNVNYAAGWWFQNVHSAAKTGGTLYTHIYALECEHFYWEGGIYDSDAGAVTYGLYIYAGVRGSLGYNATTRAQAPQMNHADSGLFLEGHSYVDAWLLNIDSCRYGYRFKNGSRAQIDNNAITNCTVGIRCEEGSTVYRGPTASDYTGTTTEIQLLGGSTTDDYQIWNARTEMLVARLTSIAALTGTTVEQQVATNIWTPPKWKVGQKIKIRILGTFSGTGGTKRVSAYYGATNKIVEFTSASGSQNAFQMDVEWFVTSLTAQTYSARYHDGATPQVLGGSNAFTIDGLQNFRVFAKLSSATDTINFSAVEIYVT